MPYTEVRIVDAGTGEPVKPHEPGEIVVRGPNVTAGYWDNPKATAAAFDDEGWFHSGDIGYFDEDGFLYIVDRLKDMIISGGENVYPAEVERVLAAMPGVVDVAVVGVADEQWGETVAAVITAAEDTVMSRSSAGLMAEYFPGVEIRAELGERQSLTSIEKAKRLLGFAPQHRWRDNLDS